MKSYGRLNAEDFKAFLTWLSLDQEEAARRFEQLRQKLVRFFERGGCHIPEDLFHESVIRSGRKILERAVEPSVDPIAYCTGVARNVLKEYRRDVKPYPLPEDVPSPCVEPVWTEQELACLDECKLLLSEHDRNLVTRYYQYEGREKIEDHKRMAAEEGGLRALRVKNHRIMNKLRVCVFECVSRNGGAPAR